MRTIIAFAFLIAAVVCVASCSRSAATYVSYPIRVIDGETKQPIAGVSIEALCTGNTPIATNVYHTDAKGMAAVMYWEGPHFVVVRVHKQGYETNFPTVSATNFVVVLNRIK